MDVLGISIPTLIAALIPAYFVARWQASSQFRNSQRQELDKEKRRVYQKLLAVLVKMIRDREYGDDMMAQLRDCNQEIMLISSGRVMKVYGDFLQTAYVFDTEDPEVNKRFIILFGELVKAMREDLGNKSFLHSFAWYDGLRINFTDVNTLFPDVPMTTVNYGSNKAFAKIDHEHLPRE